MTVIIGVDPHKSTQTAVAIDRDERPLARLRLVADRWQTRRLLAWAEPLGSERTWAVESAGGLANCWPSSSWRRVSTSIDVPPTLAARVRLLGSTKASKNDPHDALATAGADPLASWLAEESSPIPEVELIQQRLDIDAQDSSPVPWGRGSVVRRLRSVRVRVLARCARSQLWLGPASPIGTSVTVSVVPPLHVMGRQGVSRMTVLLPPSKSRTDIPCVRETVPVGALVPPDPPLAGVQAALRPFRVGDAAAIAESCRDPDIPRFTMMPEAMTEDQARQWIERGLEWWPRGLARFAVTVPPSDECAGQIGIQFDFAARRAEAFYWLDRRVRGRGIAVEALSLVTEWAFRDFGIVRVQLVTHLDNERSQRVAERCGFCREGVLRAWEAVKDEQPDVVMWSRLVNDPAPDLGHA